jgi:hypothetical protein
MSIKDRLCPQAILIFRAQIEPEEILVGFQWLDFWPWNDCKTVYPGSIPGVASSFSLPRKFRLGDLPRKAAAPSRGGRGLEKRLGIRGRASFALSVLLKPVRLCYSNALARERGSVPR